MGFFFKGIWGHSQQLINVINVFSPCGLDDKQRLWGDILSLKRRVVDWLVGSCAANKFKTQNIPA